MNKIPALIMALAITLIVLTDTIFFDTQKENKETVLVSKVIDGDTLKLADGRTIRLLNINSPEKDTNLSFLSIEYLKIFENKTINMEITGQDKYNRYLARIYTDYYINLELVKQGLASIFMVEESELKLFSRAEEEAVKNSKGIWKKSEYASCIKTEIDSDREIITISNSCTINLQHWQIKDESRKIFTFPNISQSIINLHSSQGENNKTDIYWNLKEPVWNNDRDTLYLFDEFGKLANHHSYGY